MVLGEGGEGRLMMGMLDVMMRVLVELARRYRRTRGRTFWKAPEVQM